ncbi:DUF1659 domain-containing protein [Romboutsia sp. 1001216sp1]|uniref:DUF1659 domain-containing protein n=1 Tax=unclassified Romboutsia TaxID=2626894 RepID=UPI00189DB304|nr:MULTISPECIES: DUF1659 domain-containing protein [unclassified Romboutsia]MDB8801016.1 DUF1659 domain-containing protein [Romboutsia sp. 1001216sp1]MDB8812415.1 DUF1659 domain-containing protein [Romboutsia sp. 1001216sp1]
MAVTITKNPSYLKLRFDCGKDDETGKTVVRTKSYSNVNPDATDQDVYDVGTILSSFQNQTLLEVAKVDNNTLSA